MPQSNRKVMSGRIRKEWIIMNKKELSEIKKIYSKKDCCIRQMAGCYINAKKEILSTFNKLFLNLPEEEFYKYLELLKKGLTGTIGKNIITLDFTKDAQQTGMADFFLKLKSTDLKNEEMLMRFYEQCAVAYADCQNICVLLVHNSYDVIHRNDDGAKDMDGADEVYDYLQCLIIPVKLEEPGLAYNKEDGGFTRKDTRWCLDSPVCGFLYPSFEDRSTDTSRVTIYTKKTDNTYLDFLQELLDTQATKSVSEQKEEFTEVIEAAVRGNDNGVAIATKIQKNFAERAAKEPGKILNLTKEDVKEILADSGMDDTGVRSFEKFYEEKIGNKPVAVQNVINVKELKVKTPDISITVKSGKTDAVSIQNIGGKKCIVIEMDKQDAVDVNGIKLE